MRPIRLEIHGFASFREPCVVDFSDADFFVITGPTGSGKSSLIDAMVFALYGAIPRYDDSRMVFPIITAGKQEARVRFDFAVGEEAYTAVRVTRRTKTGGATTREARLEQQWPGESKTMAGNAKEVTEAVVKLLGLEFEHFQKCVALPQGAFAEFLRAKPSDRQTLLVQLLDLHVYREMAKAANLRSKEHEQRADYIDQELQGDLALATPDRLKDVKARVKALKAVQKRIKDTEPKIAALRKELEAVESERDEARKNAKTLAAVAKPEEVTELAARQQEVRELLENAKTALKEAEATLEKNETARGKLPESGDVRIALNAYATRDGAAKQVEELTTQVTEATKTHAAATKKHTQAVNAHEKAEAALEHARRAHAAANLSEGLKIGDTCPVCAQPITKLASHAAPSALKDARTELESAKGALDTADRQRQTSAQAESKLKGQLQTAQASLDDAEKALHGQPPVTDLHAKLKKIEEANAAVNAAKDAVEKTKTPFKEAQKAQTTLEQLFTQARKTLDKTRDDLAALRPPSLDRDDLSGAWDTLATWARTQSPKESKRAETLTATAEEKRAAVDALLEDLLQKCRDLDLEVRETNYAITVARELGQAESQVIAVETQIEKAKARRTEQGQLRKQAKIESELGRLLGQRGFEAWLLERALERLCASASHILRDLSSGQYSIRVNEGRDFEVIDHNNADEPRLARTLSGGETFMASLALALALAEDVAQLAAGGAARLDALFLDEGFGTLDPDTLDTVATAIEALGARGRVVGLITHVRELAERVPVRFLVSKDARTSSVERVAA